MIGSTPPPPVASRLGKRADGAIQAVREENDVLPLAEDDHDLEIVTDPEQDPYGNAEYARLSLQEKRAFVRQPYQWAFEREANQKLWLAYRWTPLLGHLTKASCVIACVCALLAVGVVYNRPPPLTLLSFPDGGISCGPASVNPRDRSRTPIQRAPHERALCAHFAPPEMEGDVRPIEIPGWAAPTTEPISSPPSVGASAEEAVVAPVDPSGPEAGLSEDAGGEGAPASTEPLQNAPSLLPPVSPESATPAPEDGSTKPDAPTGEEG